MPSKFKCSDKQQVIFSCKCVSCNIWDILMLKNYSWLSEIQTIVLYQALVVQREASWHIIEEPYGNAPWQGSGDSLQPTAREKLRSSLQQALSNWLLRTITRVSLEVGPPSLLLRWPWLRPTPQLLSREWPWAREPREAKLGSLTYRNYITIDVWFYKPWSLGVMCHVPIEN